MDCKSAQYIFMKFLDGDCESVNNAELQEHIRTCKNCQDDFNLYKTMVDCFSDIEPIHVPCEFEQLERIILERICSIDPHFSIKKFMLKNSIAFLIFRHIIFFTAIISFTLYTICKDYKLLKNTLSPRKKLTELRNNGMFILDFCKAKMNKNDIKNTITIFSVIFVISTIVEIIKKFRNEG